MKLKIQIECDNGQLTVNVSGLIKDPLYCAGVLEAAKAVILRSGQPPGLTGADPNLIAPRGPVLPILPRP